MASEEPMTALPPSKGNAQKRSYSTVAINNLVAHANSLGRNEHTRQKFGLTTAVPKHTFPLDSKRMAAIFRLMRQLATVIGGASAAPGAPIGQRTIKDLFKFVRCSVRYGKTIMVDDEKLDAEAMIADSDQDKLMIRLIEECVKMIGYCILRALAVIREYGSPTAKALGFFAIIGSNDTLQDFVSLVNLLWIDTSLYLQQKHSAVVVFKQQTQQEANIMQRFANLVVTYPPDLKASETDYPYPLNFDEVMYTEELGRETWNFAIYPKWDNMIVYARMQNQAIHNKSNRSPMPKLPPQDKNESDIDYEKRTQPQRVARAEWACVGLDLIKLKMIQAEDSELELDGALGEGSSVYRCAFEILASLGNALSMPGGTDMWRIIQDDFVRRVKFMEAVMLKYCLDLIYAKRSDERKAVLKSSSDLLQTDLDYLVVSIHKQHTSKK